MEPLADADLNRILGIVRPERRGDALPVAGNPAERLSRGARVRTGPGKLRPSFAVDGLLTGISLRIVRFFS